MSDINEPPPMQEGKDGTIDLPAPILAFSKGVISMRSCPIYDPIMVVKLIAWLSPGEAKDLARQLLRWVDPAHDERNAAVRAVIDAALALVSEREKWTGERTVADAMLELDRSVDKLREIR